jgi:hypothetical protein
MGKWSCNSTILDLGTRYKTVVSVPGTHWIVGWVSLTAGLDAVEKRKSCYAGNRIRAVQPVARSYTS